MGAENLYKIWKQKQHSLLYISLLRKDIDTFEAIYYWNKKAASSHLLSTLVYM
jgi:hypothetical protein